MNLNNGVGNVNDSDTLNTEAPSSSSSKNIKKTPQTATDSQSETAQESLESGGAFKYKSEAGQVFLFPDKQPLRLGIVVLVFFSAFYLCLELFWCFVMRFNAMQCIALRCMQCIALRCTSLYCVALRRAALFCVALDVALHCAKLCCTAFGLRCTALHCIALRLDCVALRCTALHCVALRCAALYFNTFCIDYCIVLHCTACVSFIVLRCAVRRCIALLFFALYCILIRCASLRFNTLCRA
jgi:hypothetical protein